MHIIGVKIVEELSNSLLPNKCLVLLLSVLQTLCPSMSTAFLLDIGQEAILFRQSTGRSPVASSHQRLGGLQFQRVALSRLQFYLQLIFQVLHFYVLLIEYVHAVLLYIEVHKPFLEKVDHYFLSFVHCFFDALVVHFFQIFVIFYYL